MLRIRRFGKNRCGIIFVMHPLFEKADALTGEVIEAAIEVQKHFGIGLIENIYKQALAQLRIDCFVDRCLIVECKSLDEEKVNMIRHKAQLLSYMKLMNIPLGLVINFGDYRLGKRGIARVILKDADGGDPF